ncbi:MAG: DUF1501 domain-containing protein, partial [Planctomycetaceae bacterium]|nr:DUF1501 domain-containing protein [Planctomycetaceae bacterium]
MHCRRYTPAPLSRRALLQQAAGGIGGIALASMLAEAAPTTSASPFVLKTPHHVQRARSVIFLYMDGGPSQVDTYDPKPRLDAENGQPFKMAIQPTQFDNVGNTLASPWRFRQFGESGLPISDLLPQIRTCADDLCVVRSMTSEFSEHTNANYFLHTGHGLQGRPSMGAWFGYGLGSECHDLPAYVVLNSGLIPPGGLECFGSGFLPATYQGSVFKRGATPVANVERSERTAAAQENKLALLRGLDAASLETSGAHDAIESAIANYELAFRMQTAVPDLMDVAQETAETQRMYGLEAERPQTQVFGHACLVARRLVERGVRFIQLTCPDGNGDRWDQHSKLKSDHENNAISVDQPIAALLTDLKQRGLLDETLVVWAGEFGRTPFAQGTDGR